MSLDLLERARESRKSPAALKVKISNLRSRYLADPIFLVEGADDVGVYETWLRSFAGDQLLKIVSGSGKEQLLSFRKMLQNDKTGLAKDVYFFVDRDYDGLQDQSHGSDVFCTNRHSVENYLGTVLVCQSILRDELRIDIASDIFIEIVFLFNKALDSLLKELYEINFHIFCCCRLGLSLCRGIPDLTELVNVSLNGVTRKAEFAVVLAQKCVPSRIIDDQEKQELSVEFSRLNNLHDSRGKFIFQFFKKWFACLSDEIALHPNGIFIEEKINAKFSPSVVTHRLCAARSERPEGFAAFANSVFH